MTNNELGDLLEMTVRALRTQMARLPARPAKSSDRETTNRNSLLSGLGRKTIDMRLSLLASLAVLVGCVPAFADSSTPKEIVQSLQTVKGHYVAYTNPEQVKPIKGFLTHQLHSALLDWSTWLQQAYKAIPADDYDAKMMMPMSDNPFFGESDQTGDPTPVETISGDTATVVAKSTVIDIDGKSVLRKHTNTFQFVRVKGKWLLSDVQQESSSYPDWKPRKSDLLSYLKEQTAAYKKKRK